MLTEEEMASENKEEIVNIVEEEKAEGIEYDKVVSQMSTEQLQELLEKVRAIRKRRKNKKEKTESEEQKEEQEIVIGDK